MEVARACRWPNGKKIVIAHMHLFDPMYSKQESNAHYVVALKTFHCFRWYSHLKFIQGIEGPKQQQTDSRSTLQIPEMINKYQFNNAIGVDNIGNAFTMQGSCILFASQVCELESITRRHRWIPSFCTLCK